MDACVCCGAKDAGRMDVTCHGWRMPSACQEKGPKAMAARGSDTGINYD